MKSPYPRRRSKRSQRAILDAAAQLLKERGYADVTIDGIAACAKVGKTTIYRWWPTKASIFMELYAELASKVTPPPDSGNTANDLALLLKGTFKLYRETAAGLALSGIIAEAQSNATVSEIVRNEFAPSRRRIVANLITRGVERGEISEDLDVDLVSEIVAGASWYCVLVGSGSLTDSRAVRLTEQIMAGVTPGVGLGRAKKTPVNKKTPVKTKQRRSARVTQNA